MEIKVRNKRTGAVYSNDVSKNGYFICEIHFSMGYTEVIVQHKTERGTYPSFGLRLPPFGGKPVFSDRVWGAEEDEGEWVLD